MDKVMKIGIIGAGAIARVYLECLKKLGPDVCALASLCDSNPEKARKLASEFGFNCKVCECSKDFFDDDFDIACICVPPALHCALSVEGLAHGKHVLVEKPMALSVRQCDQMIEAAQKSGKLLGVVCQNRFKTPHMRLKRLLEAQALGKVEQVTVNSLWWRGDNYYDLWWRGTWEVEGGGCLLSHGVHHLDLLLYLMGAPLSVSARMDNLAHGNSQCEDIVSAVFKYDHAQANFMVSLVNHGEEQEIIVQGERGRLSAPFKVYCNKAMENGFPQEDTEQIKRLDELYHGLKPLEQEGHEAQLLHFINAVNGKEKLITTATDGRLVMETAMAVYKSAVTKQEVSLPLAKDDPFYDHESRIKLMPHFHEKTRSVAAFKTDKITLGRNIGS